MLEPVTDENSPLSNIASQVSTLRRVFRSGRTRPARWRVEQLRALRSMIRENERLFHEALRADLGKPEFEAWASETNFLVEDVNFTLKHLDEWMQPEKVRTNLINQPGKSHIYREPLGVVLIIGPWNYPLQLVSAPLIGAIAAGNVAIMKPSELAPRTSAVLAQWVPKYLDPSAVAVVEGGVEETQALLRERFDHIFYTGGGAVGRVVMEAAAKHLTPVTLELGGKSPCIVDRDVDLDVAARRIVWGKFFNAGQTCVAPDYVLVDETIERDLLNRLRGTVEEFYGTDAKQSPDFGRIINNRHFERLTDLLNAGDVVTGGNTDPAQRYIAPTILSGVTTESKIMQDEIFGPILPVIPVRDVDAAIEIVRDRPKPLALYVFSRNRRVAERVVENTSSGGVCVNDCIAHLSVPDLPFGGVGPSGMGAYHGRTGFETFSHRKAVLDKSTRVDPALRYPPYTERKLRWAKRLL